MADAPKPGASMPDLEQLLCFSVYSTGHAFNKVYKPLLDQLGLTYPQYLVMVTLWESDDQRVGAIGEKLFLESSTLTPLLKRLEGLGLVERRRDGADERVVRISLTEKGRGLRDQALVVPSCIAEATGLSLEELRSLGGALSKLRENLQKAGKLD